MTKGRTLKITLYIIVAAATTVAALLLSPPERGDNEGDPSRIKLAICNEMSGYYVVAGENYGFPLDIADSFAHSVGRKFEVEGYMELDSIAKALAEGRCDVATVLTSNVAKLRPRRPSEEIYTTSYVLISRRGRNFDPTKSPSDVIGDSRLVVDAGFSRIEKYSAELDALNDSLVEISPESGFDKAESLLKGKCDWFICEQSEAQIVCYLNRNLQEYYTFDEPVSVSLVFRDRTMCDLFSEWYAEFRQSDAYADLAQFYFGEERVGNRYAALRHRPTRVVGGISVWDDQIRKIAARDSVDWRLLSAIAYNESRFRGDLVSRRGAVGLMQIMPVVALEFKLDTAAVDLADPEVNITLAAKLISKTARTLNFDESVDDYNRNAIIVAVYHCGIGRISEARRVVDSLGGNPDSWDEVRASLLDMGSPDYVAANHVRGGTFRDRRMTVAYVNGVMDKYESYCEAVK